MKDNTEILEKTRNYTQQPRIEVCRNCHGTGVANGESLLRPEDRCPVCNGSGRVIKMKTVIINIRPYND